MTQIMESLIDEASCIDYSQMHRDQLAFYLQRREMAVDGVMADYVRREYAQGQWPEGVEVPAVDHEAREEAQAREAKDDELLNPFRRRIAGIAVDQVVMLGYLFGSDSSPKDEEYGVIVDDVRGRIQYVLVKAGDQMALTIGKDAEGLNRFMRLYNEIEDQIVCRVLDRFIADQPNEGEELATVIPLNPERDEITGGAEAIK